ncbi:hypothetical protein K502DRAFT_309100 [Neoconidiobolus thromboides FSU 785]|nr:hypothetical protein K502DRAFT_309100 [Neoconidiobolus thromboides FSU 785]
MKRENRTSRILELRNKFESEKAISDPPPSPTSNDIKLKRSSFNQVTSNIINTESKLKRSSLNYDKLKKWGNRWEPGLKSKSRELNQVKEKKNDETNIQESNLIDNNVIKTDEPLELLKEKEEKVEVEGNIGISTNNSVDLIKQQFDNMNIGDLEPKNLIKEGIDDIVKEEEDVTIKNNEPIDLIEESFNNVNNLDNIQQGNKNENNLNSQNEESIDLTEEGFDTINNKEETQQVKDDSIKNPEPILSTKGEALALTINQGGDIQNLISNGAIDDLSIQLKDPVWSSEEEIVNHLATDNHKRGSFLTADNSIILSEYSMSESDPSGNLRLDENGNDVLSISRLLGDDALLNENSFLNDKSGVSSSFFDEKSKLEEGLVNGHSSSFIINQEEEEDNNKPVLEWEKKESDNIVSEDSNALDKGDTKEDNLINKNIILGDNNVDSILENDSSVKLVDNKENELSNDRVVFDNSITEPKDDKVKDNEVVSPNNNQSYKNSVVLDNDNTKLINNINNDTILNNNNPLEEISGDVYKYTNNTILENSNNRLEDSILSSENTVYRKVINDGIELDNNITVNENTSMNGDVINRDIMLDNSINNSVNNNNILDSTTSMKNSKDVNAISNNNMSKETQQHKKAQLSNVSEDQLHDITSLYYEDVTNSEEENEIIESNKEYLKYLQIEIPEECYIPLQCFIYQESIAYFSLLKEFEGAIFNANIKKNYFVAWEKWQENIINAAKQLFAKEGKFISLV